MAWAHPDHKQITPVDHKGNTNPTWNYRMVFGVDDKFLSSEASAVMMEIYNVSRLSNKPIGTTWLPIDILLKNPHSEIMKKPLTLQICRPSGDFKGFLVVTVNLVNTTIRNRNDEDENPRKFMIRQLSHRLSHSESSKRMTYLEEGEDHDDVNALSDPERVSIDSEMSNLPLEIVVALKNGGMCSPATDYAGVGTSVFNDWIGSGADYSYNKETKNLSFLPPKTVVKQKSKVRSRQRRHSDGANSTIKEINNPGSYFDENNRNSPHSVLTNLLSSPMTQSTIKQGSAMPHVSTQKHCNRTPLSNITNLQSSTQLHNTRDKRKGKAVQKDWENIPLKEWSRNLYEEEFTNRPNAGPNLYDDKDETAKEGVCFSDDGLFDSESSDDDLMGSTMFPPEDSSEAEADEENVTRPSLSNKKKTRAHQYNIPEDNDT
ncbi:hypothetical protein ACET3Z_028425 [Daucus carota]